MALVDRRARDTHRAVAAGFTALAALSTGGHRRADTAGFGSALSRRLPA